MSRTIRRIAVGVAGALAATFIPFTAHAAATPHLAFGSAGTNTPVNLTTDPTGEVPGGGTYSYDAVTNTVTFTGLTAEKGIRVTDMDIVFSGENVINTLASSSWSSNDPLYWNNYSAAERSIKGTDGASLTLQGGSTGIQFQNEQEAPKVTASISDLAITRNNSDIRSTFFKANSNKSVAEVAFTGSTSIDIDNKKEVRGFYPDKLSSFIFASSGAVNNTAETPFYADLNREDPQNNRPIPFVFKGCGEIRATADASTSQTVFEYYDLFGIESLAPVFENTKLVPVIDGAEDPSKEPVFGHLTRSVSTFYWIEGNERHKITDAVIKPAQTVTGVTVSPETATVAQGETQEFSAEVAGKCATDRSVLWTLAGATSEDTAISEDGVLTVGADEAAEELTVTAISNEDDSAQASATVTVQKVFTVTFDTDGGSAAPQDQRVKDGEKATKPADPTKEGFVFVHWHPAETTDTFDFDQPITNDVDLIAVWEEVADEEPVDDPVTPDDPGKDTVKPNDPGKDKTKPKDPVQTKKPTGLPNTGN